MLAKPLLIIWTSITEKTKLSLINLTLCQKPVGDGLAYKRFSVLFGNVRYKESTPWASTFFRYVCAGQQRFGKIPERSAMRLL